MLLFDNKKQKFLNVLKLTGSPFRKFVSTGEINEELGVVQSRENILQSIINKIESNESFILPIIGDVGSGKTHLYWALRHILHHYNVVYISLDIIYNKLYYHTYSKFIKEYDKVILRSITKQLCDEWGASERKYGFFQIVDIEKIRNNAFDFYNSEFEDKDALRDVINAITTHQLDPYQKIEAERWIMGEILKKKELSSLNLKHDVRKKNNSFIMLKFLIENSEKQSILFIDDFKKNIRSMKPVKEDPEMEEEVFDRSWLYGTKKLVDDRSTDRILNKILKFLNIKGLRIIITLNSKEFFQEVRHKIADRNKDLLELLEEPVVLADFKENDIFEFFIQNIDLFFAKIKYIDYFNDFSDSYFPLNEKILKNIVKTTKGNPRETIKELIKIFNEIISSSEKLEDITDKYQ
ncbi:MAG: hypothetical protein ACFFEN_15860 [Candidatus Thorarchaeota archaeon]